MNWHIDLRDLEQGICVIETTEGHLIEGRVSLIEWETKEILGREVRHPTQLTCADQVVTWSSIQKIHKRDAPTAS